VRPRFSSPGNSTPATADHGVYRRHAQPESRGRVDLPGPAEAGLPGRRADLPFLATGQPPGRGPDRARRPDRRCAAGHQAHSRRPLRPPQDDPPSAPPRVRGGVLHRRPLDAPAGHERGPPRQGGADHHPRQGRAPCRRPVEPGLHRTGTQHPMGRRFHLLPDWAGFCYVAFIVDVFSQRIVGWHAGRQAHRPGPDPTTDRPVGPRPARPAGPPR